MAHFNDSLSVCHVEWERLYTKTLKTVCVCFAIGVGFCRGGRHGGSVGGWGATWGVTRRPLVAGQKIGHQNGKAQTVCLP